MHTLSSKNLSSKRISRKGLIPLFKQKFKAMSGLLPFIAKKI